MDIKKEYEKFFGRKKNDLCIHDAEDVINFAKHYESLQLQQTGVVGRSEQLVCPLPETKGCDRHKIHDEEGRWEFCNTCKREWTR